ncbi:ABC transporter ATP-binding protein [Streptomonospora litoralis]|uniref:Oligopeptide transport ATP-binding protein OppF n=1 Tax=Streptomonospora litoralis TaxID=2498135 RepID=A0A4P6Q2D0_9ACTN|nr:oligopeptide/dipeptide ABC transporter ATP-binding protein [Streptomonospora litoralis]QBI53019.1 Oligopeptide transport ATP-binding protein OppF [Streptomonospora litoralis]
MSEDTLLQVSDLRVRFPIRSSLLRRVTGHVEAVDGVTFSLASGRTLALVGESGCGKSSTARALIGLEHTASGRVLFRGRDITRVSAAERRRLTRRIQIVFQDPFASLNPRLTVRQILQEGWLIHRDLVPREQWDDEVVRLLELVGLNATHADRYPHQFSGGQRQRIGIARALSMRPEVIVCDEPVSALDVSIQAQILNLLDDLRAELGLTYLFISHDLHVVRHIADDIAVMYLGSIVEQGPSAQVFDDPRHPYTRALLSAAPSAYPWRSPDRHPIVLEGDQPSPADPPSGCRFRTRCFMARPECAEHRPGLEGGSEHVWACPFVPVGLKEAV